MGPFVGVMEITDWFNLVGGAELRGSAATIRSVTRYAVLMLRCDEVEPRV
jgi:hypothetical protein